MKNNSLTLYIPGLWALLGHVDLEMQHLPSLQFLLKRCDSHSVNTLESEAMLLKKLGWHGGKGDDVPVAAIEQLAAGGSSSGYWFCASPVNLQEEQRFLIMSYPSMLDLDPDESNELADSVNQHFAEDGWHIDVAGNGQWHLRIDKNPHIHTTPLWRAVGRDILALLPTGENGTQWHSWLMELQMLLFSHPVNQKRASQGLAVANGLWLWGGGELPELPDASQYCLQGNSEFMQGLSRQSGCELPAFPGNISKIFEGSTSEKEQLIMLEQAREALQAGNMDQGITALAELEEDVFKPLLELLKSKQLHSMSIVDCPGNIVEISGRGIKKWWRHRSINFKDS